MTAVCAFLISISLNYQKTPIRTRGNRYKLINITVIMT